jgi:uncharacterized membrane protein YkoI
MTKQTYLTLGSAGLAALLLALTGPALGDVSYTEAQKLIADGTVLPKEKISEIATGAHPGKITDLELDHSVDRLIYEVEVHDEQGMEWDLEIDAKTGEIIATGSERDDDGVNDD